MPFNRDSLKQNRLRRKVVTLSNGEDVHLIEMNGTTRERCEEVMGPLIEAKSKELTGTIAVFHVCDEEGNLIFTEADVPDFMAMPGSDLHKIVHAANELSKIRSEDYQELASK